MPFQCSAKGEGPWLLPTRPTAQPSVADTMLTPRSEPLLGAMAGSLVQLVPFQCKIRMPPVLQWQVPTAQPSVAETMLTPYRLPNGAAGLVTCDQLVPSQCTISGWLLGPPAEPTAHASEVDTALIPRRKPEMGVTVWC